MPTKAIPKTRERASTPAAKAMTFAAQRLGTYMKGPKRPAATATAQEESAMIPMLAARLSVNAVLEDVR